MTSDESSRVERIYASAKRGAMREALAELKAMDLSEASEPFRDLANRYKERFDTPNAEAGSQSLLEQVRFAFQGYWRLVLPESVSSTEGTQFLYDRLAPLATDRCLHSLEALQEHLKRRLTEIGVHSLWGKVLLHYEFMAWTKEWQERTVVNLPGGENVQVDITYLDDFLSLGWTGFATFDKIHNGGWATADRLYCVRPYYDLDSERFKVSFLAHEARHFADYKKYPSLTPERLEYRAKLTELILAQETLATLAKNFLLTAVDDSNSPHSAAAHRLAQRLRLEMTRICAAPNDLGNRSKLKAAALALLQTDTRELDLT